MQKGQLLLCVTVLLSLVASAEPLESGRLHPELRPLLGPGASLTDGPFGSSGGFLLLRPSDSVERIRCLVKARYPVLGTTFLGLPVAMSTGTIVALDVSLAELLLLAASRDVVYVEPAWQARPTLDRSLPAIGADLLHAAVPAVLGEGVIVGAVDTGIDYTHLDFRYDGDGDGIEESSRILAIWDQTDGFFGRRYDRSDIEVALAAGAAPGEGLVRERDTDGHGTLVMSVAAGDGSSSGGILVGVAPAAEIVAVKTSFFTSDILAGVSYIFDEAERAGRPAVVNLSLGGHSGPHDGTSLFEQGLDELAQGAGRAVVVSAGNEGDKALHVSRTLRPGGSASFSVDPRSDTLNLELWYPGASRFTLTVAPPIGAPLVVSSGLIGSAITPSGLVYVDNASSGPSPTNGDRSILVDLSGLLGAGRWSFTVADAGGAGRLDGWITSFDGTTFVEGDTASTVDEPGNAARVVTVGSFNTKARWDSATGSQDFSAQYPLGAISSFSSRGPTRDGRQKPEITAPGAWIAGALSASAPTDGYRVLPDGAHQLLLGTSFSAPHVAGTAALMLSVDPRLTGEEIKAALVRTARRDGETGTVPNPAWGFGKLAANEAVAAVEGSPPAEGISLAIEGNPVQNHAVFRYDIPAGTGAAWLRAFTVAGELVFEVPVDPDETTFSWNLIDLDGELLANGLYLVVLVAGGRRSDVERLVIAR